MKAQATSKLSIEETVDYENMVLCFPRDQSEGGVGYGVCFRGDRELVITPKEAKCQTEIKYMIDGNVYSDDQSIDCTLKEVLNLNHASLTERRKNAHRRIGIGFRSEKPLSVKKAKELVEEVLVRTNNDKLMEFCVGISQAAMEHIEITFFLKERHSN